MRRQPAEGRTAHRRGDGRQARDRCAQLAEQLNASRGPSLKSFDLRLTKGFALFGDNRLDVIAALKELDPPIMRWPGGNFVSSHEWRNAIGDPGRSSRQSGASSAPTHPSSQRAPNPAARWRLALRGDQMGISGAIASCSTRARGRG